nr:cyclase family protein [Methanosarcina sp. KYL-1]
MPIRRKIIDITVPLSPSTRVFPGDPVPFVEKVCTLEKEGCAVSRLSFGSHTGTHVDAPSHVLQNGLAVDKLELEGLVGEALVLDLSSVKGALKEEILKAEFEKAAVFGCAKVLLLKTKGRLFRGEKGLKAAGPRDGMPEAEEGFEDSAYLDESGAALIVKKGFRTVGIDNFSVDSLASEPLPAHRTLLSNRINIVECLDLSSVEAGIYFFICLPLKIEGCDGAPARAVLISYL